MRISIVIPNFNGLNFLKICLNSLERKFSEKLRINHLYIIIIDNGSTDGSREYLNDKLKNENLKNITYNVLFNNINLGFSKAVNQGIKFSNSNDSTYICLLNNDVEITSDFFYYLVESIEKDDKIFSVSSKMLQYNNKDLIDDAGDEYTLLGWTKKSGDGLSSKNYSKSREIFSSCAGAALYRKSILNKIGYFDENFFAYMEDVDISYRAQIYGYKNVYSPKAIVYHVGSGSSGSRYNEFKIKLAARNNIWLIYKNMPWPQIVINIGFLFIGFLIKYLFFFKKGYGKLYLKGLREGISNRKKIDKIKFKSSNLKNYMRIEFRLILNTFKLIFK
ncbi:glycosyltransferase family 2 protein [Methanobrevibacter sp.]|uniref:glycosyltransferase family 2 protein n=1 Tax=Methanobrevibacter sp. TaxID=66852 RepID=UPI002628F98C|nr:glycosyltransferase family 2 protein [uncultured Methanobrevibacter sp.]